MVKTKTTAAPTAAKAVNTKWTMFRFSWNQALHRVGRRCALVWSAPFMQPMPTRESGRRNPGGLQRVAHMGRP
jgi:hypothetical protein